MPGIPTQFVAANLVFDAIRKQGGIDTALLNDSNTLPVTYFCAVGGALGDFVPAHPELHVFQTSRDKSLGFKEISDVVLY
jgi:hypothetical protein